MKINIWSDIRCPFCYIGKHKFEAALQKFPHKDKVEVIWRSFELDPHLKTRIDLNMYDYFAELKGMSREQAIQMNDQVKQVAGEIGLEMNLEQSVVANSFNGHRLIQLAKAKGFGAEAKEALFKAHFTDGKNIDNIAILTRIGVSIGLDKEEVTEMYHSGTYAEEVKQDEYLAQSLGVRGVPFFVFDDKYAVSGAQSPEVFSQTLEKAWTEYYKSSTNHEDPRQRKLEY